MINAESICEELHKRRGKHRHAPDVDDTYYANFLSLIKLDDLAHRSSRPSQKAKSSNTHKMLKCNKPIRNVQEMRQSHQKRQQVNSTKGEEVNNSISDKKQNVKCNQEIYLQHSWDDIVLRMHPKQNDTKQLHKVNASNTYRYERSTSNDPSYYAESSNCVDSTISNRIKPTKHKSITKNDKTIVCTNTSSASIASSAGLTVVHDDEDSDATCLNEEYSQHNREKEEEQEEQYHHEHEFSEKINSATHSDNYNKELEFDYLQSKLNYHKMLNVFTTSFSSSTTPEWTELRSCRRQTKTSRHFAFAHNKERSTNNVVTTYTNASERAKDADTRKHNRYHKKNVSSNDTYTTVVGKSEETMPHETSVKVQRTVDVIRTPISSKKQNLHKEKPSKVFSINNTDHDNDNLDNNKKPVAKIFVTVDKLCKTIVPDESDHEHKHLEEMERKEKALHKKEEEKEEEETYYQDFKNDRAKGIYNTYDVLPPLTSSMQHFSSENEEYEEQSNTRNLINTHASNVDTRNDISHGNNKIVNKAKHFHSTNIPHQHHTSERNPFDIAIADKASIPGPGTYDLMTRSNEEESMLHFSLLEKIITKTGALPAPPPPPPSSSLRLAKQTMQHSKSHSASYLSFTFAQSQRNQYHWNNPLTERHTDKYAELYSPGPGSYDITIYNSAFEQNNKNNNRKANSAKEVVHADTQKEEKESQETTLINFVTNTNTIMKDNNITTNSNKNKTRQCEKTVHHKAHVKQNENTQYNVHETSPGPGMYDIDTAYSKNMVTRTHSAPAWTIRNTRYDVHDDKMQRYYADRQMWREYHDNTNNSSSNNFYMKDRRPFAEHHYHNMLDDVSPSPLTYDPHKYIEGSTRSTFSTAMRWGTMQGSNNDNKNKIITATTSSSFDNNNSKINLGNMYNRETEYMSVPGPGAYDPYPASEAKKHNVRESNSNNNNNTDDKRVSKKKEELSRHTSSKIDAAPGPATYYPSYDITLTHPPRTIFASNINLQLANTNSEDKIKNKVSTESNLQNGEETRNDAVGSGTYDINMSKLYHTRGGVISKSWSSSLLPEHCLGTNRKRDSMTYIGPGTYDVNYNNNNNKKNINKIINIINSEKKNTEVVNKRLCPLDNNCMHNEHLLGPGSYDTLYSEDNIRAHIPGVVMRSTSVEKGNSMSIATYNDHNNISNNKRCITEDLGPGTYDMPYTFTIRYLQNAERKEKNEVQQEESLELQDEESYYHSKSSNAKTYIDNTKNNTRQFTAEHWHRKPDKEIVDTPGPGTYYLNTAPIIHNVSIFNQYDHKYNKDNNNDSIPYVNSDNNSCKQWNDHKSIKAANTETVHSANYHDNDDADADKSNSIGVERANSIQQILSYNLTNIKSINDEECAKYNYETLQTNRDQLQERQHKYKELDNTTDVGTRTCEQLQTTKATFNKEIQQQQYKKQEHQNFYKEQETSVSGPGMYDSNSSQQHFGVNTGTTFGKAARFTNTMKISYSEHHNNNKCRNNTLEALPGLGSYAVDDYNHDFLPLNNSNNNSGSKWSAQTYNMNWGNVNNEHVAKISTINKIHNNNNYFHATRNNDYTTGVNKNKNKLEMQHSTEVKSKEKEEEEQEPHREVYHSQVRHDEKIDFLPVPEALKVVQVPHTATEDDVSDSPVQNAIMCKNDSERWYLHQHVFIRPLDDDAPECDRYNNNYDKNNHNNFISNQKEYLQTIHSQAYPLRETNVKKKRVRFALDADSSVNNNSSDENTRTSAHSMEMSTQRDENSEITFTTISEIALKRVNASLQSQQDKQLQPERVINMSPELLLQELPENKIGEEHLPYNSNINLCEEEQSTDAGNKFIIHTPWKEELLQEEEQEYTTNAALPADSLNRAIYSTIKQNININNMLENKQEYYTNTNLLTNPMPSISTFLSPYSNYAKIDAHTPNTNSKRIYCNTAVNSSVKDDKQDFVVNMNYANLQIPYYTPQDDATTLAKLAQFGYPVV